MFEYANTKNDCEDPENFLPRVQRNPENCALNVASKKKCSYRFFYSPSSGACYCELPLSNCTKVTSPRYVYNQYRLFRGMNNFDFSS